ncbi:tyrosine-type recombinase/integrase [Ralstonia pseudosolanacearum]|uniref:tyrosine-type recombinase/integrase n=1 Tax=Ralstonia pseudosolanacearum TaxID=1310165 RepID=UPI003CF4CFA7
MREKRKKSTQSQADLFQATGPAQLDADPKTSFDTWMRQQPGRRGAGEMRVSSGDIYRVQWGKFLAFLESQKPPVKLSEVADVHITAFLDSLTQENRTQRARYRKLIERVFDSVYRAQSPGYTNPAALALRKDALWKSVKGNLPTGFLKRDERAQLIQYLQSPVIWKTETEKWRVLRDRAFVAVLFGGGLKVSEATELIVNCISFEGTPSIAIGEKGSVFFHEPTLESFAVAPLKRWLEERALEEENIGNLVFPAIKDQAGPMHPVTALRVTRAIITAAGLMDDREERISPQTLRNSYIAELFESGESPLAVHFLMGFADVITAERLKVSWESWKMLHSDGVKALPGPRP